MTIWRCGAVLLVMLVMIGAALAQPSPFLTTPGGGAAGRDAGLPQGDGRDTVMSICSGCHSIRLVAQQRLSRARWDELIDWMEQEQGMAKLDPATRATVLDYLSAHLGIGGRG